MKTLMLVISGIFAIALGLLSQSAPGSSAPPQSAASTSSPSAADVMAKIKPVESGAYELSFDGKTYDIALDQPILVTTAKGETIEVSLKKNQFADYRDDIFKFRYPTRLSIKKIDQGDSHSIYLHQSGTVIMVGRSSEGRTESEVQKNLLDGAMESVRGKNVTFTPTAEGQDVVTRNISGTPRTGKVLVFEMATLHFRVEIFAFKQGSHVNMVMFQYPTEMKTDSEAAFKMVTDSITIH